jgi:hypothetical protein
MKPEWAEQREDPYTLDLSEDSLDDVTLYVQWLYSNKINIKMTEGTMTSGEHYKESQLNYTVLVRAYIFGEKVLDLAYSNAVLGNLIEVEIEYDCTPGPDVMCALYDATSDGCPARRLLARFVAYYAYFNTKTERESDRWDVQIAAYPRDLLVDIIKAMAELRDDDQQRPWENVGLHYLAIM